MLHFPFDRGIVWFKNGQNAGMRCTAFNYGEKGQQRRVKWNSVDTNQSREKTNDWTMDAIRLRWNERVQMWRRGGSTKLRKIQVSFCVWLVAGEEKPSTSARTETKTSQSNHTNLSAFDVGVFDLCTDGNAKTGNSNFRPHPPRKGKSFFWCFNSYGEKLE